MSKWLRLLLSKVSRCAMNAEKSRRSDRVQEKCTNYLNLQVLTSFKEEVNNLQVLKNFSKQVSKKVLYHADLQMIELTYVSFEVEDRLKATRRERLGLERYAPPNRTPSR